MNSNNKYIENGNYVLSKKFFNNSKKLMLNKNKSKILHNSYYNATIRYVNSISSNHRINSYYNTDYNLFNISANILSFNTMKLSLKSKYLQKKYYNNIFIKEFDQKLSFFSRKHKYLNFKNIKFNSSIKKKQILKNNFNNKINSIEQIPVTHYPTYLSNITNKKQIESNKLLNLSKISLKNKINNLNETFENEFIINNKLQENLNQTNELIEKKIFNQEKLNVKNKEQTDTIINKSLPNEILWEVVQFLSFNDCAKIALVSQVFTHLTEPRIKLKLKLVKKFFFY